MEKAWNKEKQFFGQSYEETNVLDASLLIMPLVFFSTPVRTMFIGFIMQSSYWTPVRSSVLEHAEADSAHPGERRLNI